jgi:hypothetical protein
MMERTMAERLERMMAELERLEKVLLLIQIEAK